MILYISCDQAALWWSCPSVRSSPLPSVTSFSPCSYQRIIMEFSGVITNSRDKKNHRCWPELGVAGQWLQFGFTDCYEGMLTAWSTIEEVPYYFQGHLSNFKVTRMKNHRFWHDFGVTGLEVQFDFTDGYEMMHKAGNSIDEVPYCFSRPFVKF